MSDVLSVKLPLAAITDAQQEQAELARRAARQWPNAPWHIRKKSLDARDKSRICFVYTLARGAAEVSAPPALVRAQATGLRPIVVGAGPAGLFAALLLAEAGYKPLLIEQGAPVERRRQDVTRFWRDGALNDRSNIQFGEGGAGAFSDGKLTSRSKDPLSHEVLRRLIAAGADPAIAYLHKPHLGSDVLPLLVAQLRREIIAAGGEVRFDCALRDLDIRNGSLRGITVREHGREQEIEAQTLVLAVGNGAREVYRMLAARDVPITAKPFAVGLRICQPQAAIDDVQYGAMHTHPLLGAAEYALTWRDDAHGRGCYTFCNCPGGSIVNASSEADGVVTNGVSLAARGSRWANAAIVAQIAPGRDFGTEPLSGLSFQQQLEQAANRASGGMLALPIMSAAAYLGREPAGGAAELIQTTQGGGDPTERAPLATAAAHETDLAALLPEEITAGLRGALLHWEHQLPGFTRGALLAGVETRTSAPLTVLRGTDRQSPIVTGLYPAGEGAGYAGGIMSSAIDGIKAAIAITEKQNHHIIS